MLVNSAYVVSAALVVELSQLRSFPAVAMVTDLLECAEELDDSEEVDKMDIPN